MIAFLPILFIPIVSGAVVLFVVLIFIFVSNSGGPGAGSVGRFTAAEIRAKYVLEPTIRVFRVNVEYQDGTIFLDGTVSSEEGRQMAEALAYEVSTVKNVVNNIKVDAAKTSMMKDFDNATGLTDKIKAATRSTAEQTEQVDEQPQSVSTRPVASAPQAGADTSDAAIIAEIERIRAEHRNPEYKNVEVEVKDGVIILTGSVPSKLLSLRARLVGSGIPGVKEVRDNLVVTDKTGEEGTPAK